MRCLLCNFESETEVELQTWGEATAPLCKDDSACNARVLRIVIINPDKEVVNA